MNKFIYLLLAISLFACGKETPTKQTKVETEQVEELRMSASDYNSEGMKFYNKKQYEKAATSFENAVKVDPKHKLANYNLACTYANMVDECGTIETRDVGEEYIFKQLKIAAQLDPNVKNKAPKDSDLIFYAKDTQFLEALSLLPAKNDSEGWKKIITDEDFVYEGNCVGGSGIFPATCDHFFFSKDGSFTVDEANEECEFNYEECEKIHSLSTKKTGTYIIENQKLLLEYESGKTKEIDIPIHMFVRKGSECSI
ncbi:MAG: hypothetical protein ABUK01_05195 [Leptospirales bacterium]